MAHRTVKNGYAELVDRLNRAPQGAPPSQLLDRILAMLMDEREAGLLSLLPIKPFTAKKAARIWKMPLAEAQGILEELAGRRGVAPPRRTETAEGDESADTPEVDEALLMSPEEMESLVSQDAGPDKAPPSQELRAE